MTQVMFLLLFPDNLWMWNYVQLDLFTKRRLENTSDMKNRRETCYYLLYPPTHRLYIKVSRTSSSTSVSKLKVNGSIFDCVSDGFHKSLSLLKDPDMSPIESSSFFQDTVRDFENIMELAEMGADIPPIQIHDTVEILYSVKAEVNDLFSITASHFINAGPAGLRLFHHLMTSIVDNINNSSLNVLNDIWAMILFKGHGKDKESDRSYRTISTCPLLAKCLDIYIGRRYYPMWRQVQSSVQFQGEGSSHELASVLLTEAIQHSIYVLKKPIFVLLLDAKSAFDVVVQQNAIVEAYKAGTKRINILKQ